MTRLSLIFTFALTSTIFLFSCGNNKPRQTKKTFNSKEWIENEDSRFCMLDSIIGSKMLVGKTKSEVISILGQPTFMGQEYSDGAMQYRTSEEQGKYTYWYLYVGLKNDTVVVTGKI